jgi:hypothetical protein
MDSNEVKKIAIVSVIDEVPSKEWVDSIVDQQKRIESGVIIVNKFGDDILLPENWKVYENIFGIDDKCSGLYFAYNDGFDIVIYVDSKCRIQEDFVQRHIEGLLLNGYDWVNPISKTGWYPRGYPEFAKKKKVVMNLGMWEGHLDIGNQIIENSSIPKYPLCGNHNVAIGKIPFSSLNFSICREAIPALIIFPGYLGDIWGGYIFQKILDAKNEKISYGAPCVVYDEEIKIDGEMVDNQIEREFYDVIDILFERMKPICKKCSYKDVFARFSEEAKALNETRSFSNLVGPIQRWSEMFRNI